MYDNCVGWGHPFEKGCSLCGLRRPRQCNHPRLGHRGNLRNPQKGTKRFDGGFGNRLSSKRGSQHRPTKLSCTRGVVPPWQNFGRPIAKKNGRHAMAPLQGHHMPAKAVVRASCHGFSGDPSRHNQDHEVLPRGERPGDQPGHGHDQDNAHDHGHEPELPPPPPPPECPVREPTCTTSPPRAHRCLPISESPPFHWRRAGWPAGTPAGCRRQRERGARGAVHFPRCRGPG